MADKLVARKAGVGLSLPATNPASLDAQARLAWSTSSGNLEFHTFYALRSPLSHQPLGPCPKKGWRWAGPW